MAEKWKLDKSKITFTTAYDYIDNYYSTWYNDPDELALPDLSENS